MNIAFPAFFILVLIIPGFIFQNSYEKVENTSIEKKPFDVSSSLAFFYALILHIFLIYLLVPLFGNEINYEICLKLLTGSKSVSESDLKIVSASIPKIILYFSSSFLLAYILGKIFQKLIFHFNPYKSSRYAFDTPWYYELTGKLSETQNAELIKLSCLVESKNISFLYYGVLEDFYLDSSGQLDRVVLSDAMRRPIELDKPLSTDSSVARFYEIKGDRLILKYEDIKNINIEYLYIIEEE
ncbi:MULTISPECIES: hypothetical protein [Pseudoalteromonas]|jgi:hypothetical protein|uniref:Uncharacterized protein n=1 Tax=Pseudoalteromonas agarivorans DSM 14585 TaxID=1312369 RepID=A0ACA8E1Q8_9GAMM|nr:MULTISPECIES: hypothetical protein [Pseudoalteromonas]ATC84171.1 hypothetical protein PAGA_b0219 [Pseudoalteromonas agarivorans DSM 14585]MDC9501537.1 hypothetical protein [Pseudoalteromonas sp. Angola-18]MDC9524075.1 hypothetical protein [Pseudoalteromonas sp. Angola-30]MDC9530785.1 hypothetical protein [Pseudoalteromonas sp. Angola-7]|tara:strand:+ start:392 stop:1114 length:723 start_codon:yes stop_codon:yes gene_type:complete